MRVRLWLLVMPLLLLLLLFCMLQFCMLLFCTLLLLLFCMPRLFRAWNLLVLVMLGLPRWVEHLVQVTRRWYPILCVL